MYRYRNVERSKVLVSDCVRCGECCKASACGFGRWDRDLHHCLYLVPDGEILGSNLYACSIHDQIILDPTSAVSPAFGAGCCRTLFNESRERILNDRSILARQEKREI